MEKVAIVSACFNEGRTVQSFVDEYSRYFGLDNLFMIDDGSTDSSYELLSDLLNSNNIFRTKSNIGQCDALLQALNSLPSTYAYAVCVDCDMQHKAMDASGVAEVLVSQSCEVVIGSRFLDLEIGDITIEKARACINELFADLFFLQYGISISDCFSGMIGLNLKNIAKVFSCTSTYSWTLSMWHSMLGYNVDFIEVPIERVYLDANRVYKDKYSSHKALLEDIIVQFTKRVDIDKDCRILQLVESHVDTYKAAYLDSGISPYLILEIFKKELYVERLT